jgi:hypothetical protein
MPTLERTKLYKDVWSRPCTKIAAELGISSSALKWICTEMDIPTPVASRFEIHGSAGCLALPC